MTTKKAAPKAHADPPRRDDPWARYRTIPTTNYRIYWTVKAGLVFPFAVLALHAIGKPPSEGMVWALGAFIAVLGGLDVAQFTAKRKTQAEYVAAAGASRATA